MKNILFLCTGNSCRSQMAEAWGRQVWRGKAKVHSAGTEPSLVNPWAVKVMKQHGVDMSGQYSKSLNEFDLNDLDLVITVCNDADQKCPILPADVTKFHKPFDDPPALCKDLEKDGQKYEVYSRVAIEIRDFIETFDIDKY